MAFVNDDEVKELRRNLLVIDDRNRLSGLRQLRRIYLFRGFVHLLALEKRIHALDGANADLTVPGDEGRFETLDVVEFGEFSVVVIGYVRHEFLLGLFTQMLGVYQKENPLGVCVFE